MPFPSPGDLTDPEIEPESPARQADSLSLSHQGSPSHELGGGKNGNYCSMCTEFQFGKKKRVEEMVGSDE